MREAFGRLGKRLGGVLGAALAAVLFGLDFLGRLLVAAQVIEDVPFDLALLALAGLFAINVIYQQRMRLVAAQDTAARLQAALDERPDPKAVTRSFLALHDQAAGVAFGTKIPYPEGTSKRELPESMSGLGSASG